MSKLVAFNGNRNVAAPAAGRGAPPLSNGAGGGVGADDACPICRNDKCENCITRLFLAGPAPCPVCKQTLRKSDFVAQTFEDLRVEKEIRIRKRIGKYFNKRLEDFENDLRKYNDYLEEVEDIMFNLINDVDVQATNEKIERFRQENKEIIAANMSKQVNEDKMVTYRLKREREEKLLRKEAYIAQAMLEARAKELEKESVINELLTSDKPAQDIVETFKKKQTSSADSMPRFEVLNVSLDDEEMNMPLVLDDPADFDAMDNIYRESILLSIAPSYNDPWTLEAASNRAARGSGFLPHWAYSRAIFSAFAGVTDGT